MCANRGGGKVHLGVDSTPTLMTLGKECWLVGNFFPPREQTEKKITLPSLWAVALTTSHPPAATPPPPLFHSWHVWNSLSSLLLGLSHDTWDTWEPITCHPVIHYLTWCFCFSEATPSHHSRKNSCSTAMKRRCCLRVNSSTTVV